MPELPSAQSVPVIPHINLEGLREAVSRVAEVDPQQLQRDLQSVTEAVQRAKEAARMAAEKAQIEVESLRRLYEESQLPELTEQRLNEIIADVEARLQTLQGNDRPIRRPTRSSRARRDSDAVPPTPATGTGRQGNELPKDPAVRTLRVDGMEIAIDQNNETITATEPESGKTVWTLRLQGASLKDAVQTDGNRLIISSGDGNSVVVDAQTGVIQLRANRPDVAR
jgi:hypothetical protein